MWGVQKPSQRGQWGVAMVHIEGCRRVPGIVLCYFKNTPWLCVCLFLSRSMWSSVCLWPSGPSETSWLSRPCCSSCSPVLESSSSKWGWERLLTHWTHFWKNFRVFWGVKVFHWAEGEKIECFINVHCLSGQHWPWFWISRVIKGPPK